MAGKKTNTLPREETQSFPVAEVTKESSPISQSGAKYQYPLEIASKTARLNPRNERGVLEGALDELSLSPDLAAESYYSIPRRKKLPDGNYDTVKIEGPSIGAAMSLARRWGNCINGSHVREELDDRIVTEGVFIDAQTNTWTFRTITADKFYTDRNTKLKKSLAPDMLLNAIQAAQSKAVRNAILSTLPKWLTRAYFLEAKRIAGGGDLRTGEKAQMSPEDCMAWLVKHFPAVGVTEKMLTDYISANMKEMTLVEQVGELRGIYNSLKDKQATVTEIFGDEKVSPNSSTAGSGPVSGGSLFPSDDGTV